MDLRPAPVTDLDDLLAAYLQTARAVLELARDCPPARAGDPTPCPGWSVFDQVAHVESVEAWLHGAPLPDKDIGARPHVRSDMGVVIERLVESRRHLSLPELCDRLEETITAREALLGSAEVTVDTQLPSPFGPMVVADLLRLRCFDIWTHEQDLRETLAHPGNLSTPAAVITMERMYASLGRIAVAAGIPVGAGVVVELTGPVTGRGSVRVVDRDGKLRGVTEQIGDADALCVLKLGTRSAGRFLAGREAVGAGGFAWTAWGDGEAAAALVRHFPVTP